MWDLHIEKVENGYICSHEEEMEDDSEERKVKTIIEEKEVDAGDKLAMSELLSFIADYFGFMYQKYNKDNLRISWDLKGSKVE